MAVDVTHEFLRLLTEKPVNITVVVDKWLRLGKSGVIRYDEHDDIFRVDGVAFRSYDVDSIGIVGYDVSVILKV